MLRTISRLTAPFPHWSTGYVDTATYPIPAQPAPVSPEGPKPLEDNITKIRTGEIEPFGRRRRMAFEIDTIIAVENAIMIVLLLVLVLMAASKR
jgi:hypothetical protein